MRASVALVVLVACAEQAAVPPVPTGALSPEPLPPAKAAPPPPARREAPSAPEELSVPGPMAFPCPSDASCGTHRCNVRYGKCAFPCQSDVDCQPGDHCTSGLCIPTPP